MKQTFVVRLLFGAKLVLSSDMDEALTQIRIHQYQLDHLAPLLRQVAAILRLDAREQFAEGGNPAWKPLAPSTIAAKQAAGMPSRLKSGRIPRRLIQNGVFGSTAILIARGDLRDSWGRLGAKGHSETINEQDGTVEIGSSLLIARFHQGGTKPYPISPKAGKVLAFMGAAGSVFTSKPIKHPGLAARPVVITDNARQKAIRATEDYFIQEGGAVKGSDYFS